MFVELLPTFTKGCRGKWYAMARGWNLRVLYSHKLQKPSDASLKNETKLKAFAEAYTKSVRTRESLMDFAYPQALPLSNSQPTPFTGVTMQSLMHASNGAAAALHAQVCNGTPGYPVLSSTASASGLPQVQPQVAVRSNSALLQHPSKSVCVRVHYCTSAPKLAASVKDKKTMVTAAVACPWGKASRWMWRSRHWKDLCTLQLCTEVCSFSQEWAC